MTVETAVKIADLNVALPDGTDDRSEGDNHLRLLKIAVKSLILGVPGAADFSTQPIVGTTLTPTNATVAVQPEGANTSGTVDTISQATGYQGSLLLLRVADPLKPITIQHKASGVGRVSLVDGGTYLLDDVNKAILLQWISATWREVTRLPSPTAGQINGWFWGGTTTGPAAAQIIAIASVAATLAPGTKYRMQAGATNTGALTLTVNANSPKAVLTRGGAPLVAGEWVAGLHEEVMYDGTAFRLTRGLTRKTTYTANATWTRQPGLIMVDVEVQAGGGGGGGAPATASGEVAAAGGGGGGGYARKNIKVAVLGATEAVTVGTGGAGGPAGTNNGSVGGASGFGAHATASGGGGGTGSIASASTGSYHVGGAGGVGANGDLNAAGSAGLPGQVNSGGLRTAQGTGGASVLGGGGRVVQGGANPGGKYGGGGSGVLLNQLQAAAAGGAGGDGAVILVEYF